MRTNSTSKRTITQEITHPENYLHRFNFETDQVSFISMDRMAFKNSTFLDDRINSISSTPKLYNLTECTQSIESNKSGYASKFIFHTAYCCSTLLSRALDINNKTIVYREPVPLHQLAVMQRRKEQFASQHINNWNEYLNLTLILLSKAWNNEIPIIKPTDSCNNIIREILTTSEKAAAILLYSRLEDFIASNLKSKGRREFLTNFVMRSYRDSRMFQIFNSIKIDTLNTAQSATFVWMVQMMLYQNAIQHKNCRTLDAAKLLDKPFNTLKSASQYFSINLSNQDIYDILGSSVWNKHAKDTNSSSFSSEDRLREKRDVLSQNKKEVSDAIQWAYTIADWNQVLKNIENHSL